jgi:hypothetical protein
MDSGLAPSARPGMTAERNLLYTDSAQTSYSSHVDISAFGGWRAFMEQAKVRV